MATEKMASGGDDVADSSEAAAKRNLVVDQASFEDEFLKCHKCQEKYSNDDRQPKSLPCNHTFCLICLKQVFDHHQQNTRRAYAFADDTIDGVLKCPTCRVEIFLSRSEISALPTDRRVIQMLDFMSQVVTKSQNACSKHEHQPLNFFCKTCNVPVCRDCTVLDHKEQQGHIIADVSEALNESSEEFNNVEKRSKGLLDKMKGRSDSLANASKRLDILERQLKSKIKDTFIDHRLLLEKRQEGLIEIMHEMIKAQKQQINSRFVDICQQGSELQKLYDTFCSSRKSNDLQQLFTINKKMKDGDTEFSAAAEANDDALFVTCKFEVNNEPSYLAEMSGLGDIDTEADMELKKPVPAHQLYLLDLEERRNRELERNANEVIDISECDDLMVTHVESSSGGTSVRSPRSRVRHHDMLGMTDELMEEDETSEALASSYLLRIASRLNASAADMAEALMTQSTGDTEVTPVPPSVATNRHGTGSSGSRRSQQNVRVVRHPQQFGYLSSRYSSNNDTASRYHDNSNDTR